MKSDGQHPLERNPTPVLGSHIVAELWGCNAALLGSVDHVLASLAAAAEAASFSVVSINCRKFEPQGVTAIVLLEESHMCIHTWPEHGYAAVDVFACAGEPWNAVRELRARFLGDGFVCEALKRGPREKVPDESQSAKAPLRQPIS